MIMTILEECPVTEEEDLNKFSLKTI